ncbi:MAG: hypothetical protein AAB442_01205 [Patescibacteria group bacterium]
MNTTTHRIVASLKRLRRSSYEDPERGWVILITLAAIVLAGIIIWDIWAFDTVAKGGVIGRRVASTTPAFDSAVIDKIQGIFDTRAAEEAKYITGAYHFTDPSQ